MPQLVVGDICINLVRKKIKNMHLGVYPPDGRVRVSAPLAASDAAVRLFVNSKLAWVRRHQARFTGQERQQAMECVTGESHYFQGRCYLLNLIHHHGHARISLRNSTVMDMQVKAGASADYRQRLLANWYRQQLKAQIPALIEKWEPIMGVRVAEWGVKLMKTKWGTCNIRARRIWLNLELAKKPPHLLEYLVVHEMTHLLERRHNDHFKQLLDRFLPQWRQCKEELNRARLGQGELGEC